MVISEDIRLYKKLTLIQESLLNISPGNARVSQFAQVSLDTSLSSSVKNNKLDRPPCPTLLPLPDGTGGKDSSVEAADTHYAILP